MRMLGERMCANGAREPHSYEERICANGARELHPYDV